MPSLLANVKGTVIKMPVRKFYMTKAVIPVVSIRGTRKITPEDAQDFASELFNAAQSFYGLGYDRIYARLIDCARDMQQEAEFLRNCPRVMK